MTFGAVIMIGAAADSLPERLVLEAQRAATLDLIEQLQKALDCPIIVSSPHLDWLPADQNVIRELDPVDQPFHFGRRLADLIELHHLERVLYFGGGSAPLVDAQMLGMLGGLLLAAGSAKIPAQVALTNNRHSSDWVCFTEAHQVLPLIRQSNRDNSLAWSLQETGEYEIRVMSGIRPSTSMDLDTPTDLAIIRAHPECPPHLQAVTSHPSLDRIPVQPIVDTLRREGSQVIMIGRVSPLAWQAVNKVTRCWLRVFAEERGMVGSERLERGEVRSLLGLILKDRGAVGFFAALADMGDAVIMDNRVLFADHYSGMPSAADRFASDMYDVDAITDPWLREFTQAALASPIPVLMGGHTVVAGGLYAIAEMLAATSG